MIGFRVVGSSEARDVAGELDQRVLEPSAGAEKRAFGFTCEPHGFECAGLYPHDLAGLHSVTASFTGTGNPLRLRVQEQVESTGNDNGFVVDNFSVTLTAIPEPAAIAVFLGLIAVGFAGWQRRFSPGG